MTFLLGLASATLGMLCLASNQAKYARVLFKAPLPSDRGRTAAWIGWALLLVSGAVGIEGYGLGVGLVSFFACSCFGAWGVALLITLMRERSGASTR